MLTIEARAHAITDFSTNRTGFVISPPSEVAGHDLTVTHTMDRLKEPSFRGWWCPTACPRYPRALAWAGFGARRDRRDDDLAMMLKAIEQRGNHLGIAEDGGPFAKCQIGV